MTIDTAVHPHPILPPSKGKGITDEIQFALLPLEEGGRTACRGRSGWGWTATLSQNSHDCATQKPAP